MYKFSKPRFMSALVARAFAGFAFAQETDYVGETKQ